MGFYEALLEQNTRKQVAKMHIRELELHAIGKKMEEEYNFFTENKGI